MQEEKITFYRDWLPLDKKDFRIMALLADVGQFKGNLTDMCRYFSLNPQTRARNQLRESIQRLADQGLIEREISGRTYTLRAFPKDEIIKIPREWLHTLLRHEYSSESVAWEAVLKVLLWVLDNEQEIITNADIAAALNISVSTIGCAKNVLENEFEAITRRKVSEKLSDDSFRTIGQHLEASAWWTES